MTKDEARQFRDRWDLVKQARFAEVRQMSPERKLRDVEMLFEFGETLGWGDPAGADSWEYWKKLKELSHVQR